MRKKLLVVIIALTSLLMVEAQAFEGKGDVKINAGFNAFGYGSGIAGSVDFGLMDWMSIGAGTTLYFSNREKYKDEHFFFYGRLNFHLGEVLNLPPSWDVYPGINLGLLGDSFGLGAHVGARYFFNDTWGIFAEVGNHGTLGVSLNL